MKKILFAAYSLDYGGIETALVTLIKYLSKSYDVTLVLEKKQGIYLNDIPDNVNIIEYSVNNNKNVLLRKIINFKNQIKFKRKYKKKFDFAASFATYSLPCSFIARTASNNSALWVHNDYMNFYNNDLIQYKDFFNDLNVGNFRKIVFVSKLDEKVFKASLPQYSKNTEVCNNLIDYKKIIELSNEEVDDYKKDERITFVNISRHDEKQKRLSRIINATRTLNSKGYKFRVLFIGKGTSTENYKEEAKDLDNIEFLGAKKNPYPYLKNSDCLIMSSKFEGYPVTFIEAKVLQKPIVTTDVSDAMQDINEKYGIVTKNDDEDFYKGMKRFLDSGFETTEFDAEEFNQSILKNIERIIENK